MNKKTTSNKIRNMTMLSLVTALLMAPQALAQEQNNSRHRPDRAQRGERMDQRFEKQDRNGDGLLSLEEMRDAALKHFQKQDRNGDGQISLQELQQSPHFQRARNPQRAQQHLQQRFQQHDSDGNGVITQAEHLAALKAQFAKMDTNQDGRISKEEIKAMHQQQRAQRRSPQ